MQRQPERVNDEVRANLLAYPEARERDPGPKLAAWIDQYPPEREDLAQVAGCLSVRHTPALERRRLLQCQVRPGRNLGKHRFA